jgi:hypothetical protein
VAYIADFDIKGNIPQFVQQLARKKQGELVSKIEPSMKKASYRLRS